MYEPWTTPVSTMTEASEADYYTHDEKKSYRPLGCGIK